MFRASLAAAALSAIAFGSCTTGPDAQQVKNHSPAAAAPGFTGIWQLKEVAPPYLKFSNGQALHTRLHDLHYIGQVPVPDQPPYLLYSGRYCSSCDARQMLYLSRPAETPLDTDSGKHRLLHPGIMTDAETGEVLYKARTFYGTVLDTTRGVIWYQESLSDYNTYIPNIYLIRLSRGGRTDTTFAFESRYLQQTLRLLEKGACVEVPGLEYLSEP